MTSVGRFAVNIPDVRGVWLWIPAGEDVDARMEDGPELMGLESGLMDGLGKLRAFLELPLSCGCPLAGLHMILPF